MQSPDTQRSPRGGGAVRVLHMVMAAFLAGSSLAHAASPVNDIEALTWPEVRARLQAGATTVLVPIGGTEQNGPYIAIGKHNVRARLLANAIADKLGNALVAPVMAYVPEGAVHPPTGHMRFIGTITIPRAAFEAMLESTARSFKQHGFRDVVFLGDHGGYQDSETRVAKALNREWARDPATRVHALVSYYETSQAPYFAALKARGYGAAEVEGHAGLADTALTMALDKSLVRTDKLAQGAKPHSEGDLHGDPRRASAELGQIAVEKIISTSVADIEKLTRASR